MPDRHSRRVIVAYGQQGLQPERGDARVVGGCVGQRSALRRPATVGWRG
eukprot:gene5188-32693_t